MQFHHQSVASEASGGREERRGGAFVSIRRCGPCTRDDPPSLNECRGSGWQARCDGGLRMRNALSVGASQDLLESDYIRVELLQPCAQQTTPLSPPVRHCAHVDGGKADGGGGSALRSTRRHRACHRAGSRASSEGSPAGGARCLPLSLIGPRTGPCGALPRVLRTWGNACGGQPPRLRASFRFPQKPRCQKLKLKSE